MSASTTVWVGRTRQGYVIGVEGRATLRESPAVQEFAQQVLEQEGCSVVLDLADCAYLDSTFLGCLVGLHKRFEKVPPARFEVVVTAEIRQRFLGPTMLDTVLQCSETRPDLESERVPVPPQVLESSNLGRHVLECHQRLLELGGQNVTAFQPVVDRLARDLAQRSPSG